MDRLVEGWSFVLSKGVNNTTYYLERADGTGTQPLTEGEGLYLIKHLNLIEVNVGKKSNGDDLTFYKWDRSGPYLL